jgi:hypothetical protein
MEWIAAGCPCDGVEGSYVPSEDEVEAALSDAKAMMENMRLYGTIDTPKSAMDELTAQAQELNMGY